MSTGLRTHFLNYMTLQRFSKETKRHYVMAVNGLAKFYNQSPDALTNDQIQEYFRHLLEDRNLSWGTCNNYFSGILCFYREYLQMGRNSSSVVNSIPVINPRIVKTLTAHGLKRISRMRGGKKLLLKRLSQWSYPKEIC